MEGWMEAQKDRWKDGQKDRHTLFFGILPATAKGPK